MGTRQADGTFKGGLPSRLKAIVELEGRSLRYITRKERHDLGVIDIRLRFQNLFAEKQLNNVSCFETVKQKQGTGIHMHYREKIRNSETRIIYITDSKHETLSNCFSANRF